MALGAVSCRQVPVDVGAHIVTAAGLTVAVLAAVTYRNIAVIVKTAHEGDVAVKVIGVAT